MTHDELLIEAAGWLEDCFSDVPDGLTDDEIIDAVNRHYDGGWAALVEASA